MIKFLRKTSIFKVFTKKRIFLLCGAVVFVLIIIPLKPALAWTEWLNPGNWIPGAIGGILVLILAIAKLALQVSNYLLTVAIGNPWGVSFTTPGTVLPANPIIQIGWTLLRDITNMLFILGLAYIGLATSLNLSSFNTKKTFSNLLLIAVLINFTPVICGIVVDITNIVSSFFLQGIDFQILIDVFSRQQADIARQLGRFTMDNGLLMLKGVFLIGYGFVASFVITLYAVLFLVRAPIIWVLVIFSPLAFFAWIFEKTKSYFKQWWDIFFQWATIVIPAAFFLYLSQQVIVQSRNIVSFPETGLMGKLINEIAPYSVALFFLIIGLIMTMKMNAMGASAITGGTKTLLKKGGSKAGSYAKKGATKARDKWNERAGGPDVNDSGYKDWAQTHKVRATFRRAGRYALGGESDKEKAKTKTGKVMQGIARGGLAAVTGGGSLVARKAGRKIGAAADESAKKGMSEAQEKFKGKGLSSKKRGIQSTFAKTRVAAMMQAIEEGDNISAMNLSDSELRRVMEDAVKVDPSSMFKLRDANPFMAAEIAEKMHLSDSRKKEAGIFIKKDDQEKYQQVVGDDDERVQAMDEDEKKAALRTDKKTGKAILVDGKEQYRVNYTEKINQDDSTVKGWDEDERKKRLIKDKDGKDELDDDGKKQYKKDISPLAAKLIAEVKTNSMEKTWNEDLAEQVAGSDIAHDFWEGAQVGKAASLFSSKFIETFRDKMQENGAEHYAEKNVKLSSYFKNTAARSLGLDFDETVSAVDQKAVSNKESELAQKQRSLKSEMDLNRRKDIEEEIEILNTDLTKLNTNAAASRQKTSKQALKKSISRKEFEESQAKERQPNTGMQKIRNKVQPPPTDDSMPEPTEPVPAEQEPKRKRQTRKSRPTDDSMPEPTKQKSKQKKRSKKSRPTDDSI